MRKNLPRHGEVDSSSCKYEIATVSDLVESPPSQGVTGPLAGAAITPPRGALIRKAAASPIVSSCSPGTSGAVTVASTSDAVVGGPSDVYRFFGLPWETSTFKNYHPEDSRRSGSGRIEFSSKSTTFLKTLVDTIIRNHFVDFVASVVLPGSEEIV